MKKIVALLMAVMMMGTVAAGCGGNNGSTEETAGKNNGGATETEVSTKFNATAKDFGDEKDAKIKVWGPSESVDLLTKQCDEFVAMFPEQNIKYEIVAQSESDASSKLLNDPEQAADVFGFPSDQFNTLVKSKALLQVGTAYANNVKASDLEDAVSVCTSEDTLYAFPQTGNGYYLVYDKSVVTDEDAKTFEGVLEACKKGGKKFVMDAGNGFYSCVFAFTGGLKIDGLDEEGKQKFTDYDEEELVATLKAFSKLMHDYTGTFTSLDVGNVASGFASKQVGAGIDGCWNSSSHQEYLGEDYGVSKLPTINVNGEDKQMLSLYGYKMLGVNAKSKYPRTAQILAYYLTSEDCQKQRVEELGWSPTNNAVIESDVVQNNAAIKALLDQGANSCLQANMADTFWNPMGTLGSELNKPENDPETYDFAELVEKTIANIRG